METNMWADSARVLGLCDLLLWHTHPEGQRESTKKKRGCWMMPLPLTPTSKNFFESTVEVQTQRRNQEETS